MLHELAQSPVAWRAEGTEFAVVRATQTLGLGSRTLDEVLLINARGDTAGQVAGASASARVRELVGSTGFHNELGTSGITIDVTRADAAADGLACAGQVEALVQRLDNAPALLWSALEHRIPVALAVGIAAAADLPSWLVVTADAVEGSIGDATIDAEATTDARYHLARGVPNRRMVQFDDTNLLIEVFAPSSRMVVVGAGELVVALGRQGTLLGWDVDSSDIVDDAVARVRELGPGDAVVVLSHDAEVDAPVMAAAIEVGVGYLGALGSRRTQAARRQRLAERGVSEADLDAIHGPVGLDLGARTPAETAMAVFAEIVKDRAGRSASSLRELDGSIHATT
jgi:xanthine dehydrogenase accessory factor